MKNKKVVLIIAIIIIIIIIFLYFNKNSYKTLEFGNNTIKSIDDAEEYILNISSYEAKVDVEIISNKNTNKYKMEQKFSSPNIFKQEVIEPNNIQGLTTIYDGANLRIENTELGLAEIYQNYQYISANFLCLYNFIEDYKNSSNAKIEEKNDYIVMEMKLENSENKYISHKKLYIDKSTLKPTKLEVRDWNQKILVYILYNEIKVNNTNKEEVLAFRLDINKQDI